MLHFHKVLPNNSEEINKLLAIIICIVSNISAAFSSLVHYEVVADTVIKALPPLFLKIRKTSASKVTIFQRLHDFQSTCSKNSNSRLVH